MADPDSSPLSDGAPAEREHGGGIDAAVDRWGRPREAWLDLSTGINPHAYPLPPLPTECWQRLPDAGVLEHLREAARRYYGALSPASVVPATGSQALIQWLPHLLEPARVAVFSPTYNEHVPAWRAGGHLVSEVGAPDDVGEDVAVLVVVNPNNPDGRRLSPEFLCEQARSRMVVVDEAFADTEPEISVAPWVGDPALELVVLRSTGKFFGLAGMRLGFAIAAPTGAAALASALGPWPVSGPAAAVGTAALADEAWIAAMRIRLKTESQHLHSALAGRGLAIVGGTDLFRLVEDARATDLFEHLARAGILVRRFADRPERLRFGLPGPGEARLAAALAEWPAGGEARSAATGR